MRAPVEDAQEVTRRILPEATRQPPLGAIHRTLPEATRQALLEAICQIRLRDHQVAALLRDHLAETHPKGHLVEAHLRAHQVAALLKDHQGAHHPRGHPVAAHRRDHPVETHPKGHPVGAHPRAHQVAASLRDHQGAHHPKGHPEADHLRDHLVAARLKGHLVVAHLRALLEVFPTPGGKALPGPLVHQAPLEPPGYKRASPPLSRSTTHSPSRHQHHPGSKLPNQRISREGLRRPRSS